MFRLVRCGGLSEQDFEEYPVWSEFYDPDEIEEIVSWGIDREWLEGELNRLHDGSDHAAYPVLVPNPLPERMRIYIRTTFKTPEGMLLPGWVMNEDAVVVGIFCAGREFTLSSNPFVADLNHDEVMRLSEALGRPPELIFPLEYWTQFHDSESRLIAGVIKACDMTE